MNERERRNMNMSERERTGRNAAGAALIILGYGVGLLVASLVFPPTTIPLAMAVLGAAAIAVAWWKNIP